MHVLKALSLDDPGDLKGWNGLSLNQALEDSKTEAFNAWARRSVASMVRAISISASKMPYFAGNN